MSDEEKKGIGYRGMTYLQALEVLKKPGGKVARHLWNGQKYLTVPEERRSISRTTAAAFVYGVKTGVCIWESTQTVEDIAAADWIDVSGGVRLAEALRLLRSGAWKGALRLSWHQPCWVEKTNARGMATPIEADVKEAESVSVDWSVCQEFVMCGVISKRRLPFENTGLDWSAFDWVEARPEAMQTLMPQQVGWPTALDYLKAGYPVRHQNWAPWQSMRYENGQYLRYTHNGTRYACTPNPEALWDIVVPDGYVDMYELKQGKVDTTRLAEVVQAPRRSGLRLKPALELARQLVQSDETGVMLRRKSWAPLGKHVLFIPTHDLDAGPGISRFIPMGFLFFEQTPEGVEHGVWTPTLEDRLAGDWEVRTDNQYWPSDSNKTIAKQTDLPFEAALAQMKKGLKMARRNWFDRKHYVVGNPGESWLTMYAPMGTMAWAPTNSDMFTDDWYEVVDA